jgi:hypothetical protein
MIGLDISLNFLGCKIELVFKVFHIYKADDNAPLSNDKIRRGGLAIEGYQCLSLGNFGYHSFRRISKAQFDVLIWQTELRSIRSVQNILYKDQFICDSGCCAFEDRIKIVWKPTGLPSFNAYKVWSVEDSVCELDLLFGSPCLNDGVVEGFLLE